MPRLYCTSDDVVAINRLLQDDIDTNIIPGDVMDYMIEEASEMVRQAIQGRYDITEVEALTELPIPVVKAAALKAAELLQVRAGSRDMEFNDGLIKQYRKAGKRWWCVLSQGTLTDPATGEPLKPIFTVDFRQSSSPRVEEAYANNGCTSCSVAADSTAENC